MRKTTINDINRINFDLEKEHPLNNEWDRHIVPILRKNRLSNLRQTRRAIMADYDSDIMKKFKNRKYELFKMKYGETFNGS